jgi:hypothetical protein
MKTVIIDIETIRNEEAAARCGYAPSDEFAPFPLREELGIGKAELRLEIFELVHSSIRKHIVVALKYEERAGSDAQQQQPNVGETLIAAQKDQAARKVHTASHDTATTFPNQAPMEAVFDEVSKLGFQR